MLLHNFFSSDAMRMLVLMDDRRARQPNSDLQQEQGTHTVESLRLS